MQRLIVPTAPSERAKWVQLQPRRSGWLILTLLLSLGAGFAGALVARVYQLEWLQPTTPDIVIVPNNAVSASAKLVESLQDEQADAIVLLAAATTWIGQGVVVSNDGWIVATQSQIGDETIVLVTTNAGKTYTSDNIVVDQVSGLAYIHVPSTGLRVGEFRDRPLLLGESVIAYGRTSQRDQVAFANVAGLVGDEDSQILLDRPLSDAWRGAAIYDFDFTIVGFVNQNDQVIPIQEVNAVAYSLFTEGTVERND